MKNEQSEETHMLPRPVHSLLGAGLCLGALLVISSCEMPAITKPGGNSQPGSVAVAPDTASRTIGSAVNNPSVVIGEPNILSTDDYYDGNYLQAQQTSLGQSATVQTLSMYVTRVAGKLRLGIYDATGPKGGPGAKKAETNEITPVVGWNTASVIAPVLLPAGSYWLAYVPSSNSLHLRWTNTGTSMYFSYPYGPMPQTFSTQTSGLTNHWSFYATLSLAIAANNPPPTVGTAASASPNPVSGKTTNVSVMGADGSGEASLVYTWSATGPSAVSFSPNATNAAKNSLATFAKAGNYVLQSVIADPQGQTATSSVNVTVTQTLASITVNPGSATVATGATQQFTGSASDQFAGAMLPQPAFVWTVSGGGTISSTGLFTAASASGGPFTVTATSNSLLGTANVVIKSNPPPTVGTAASASPNPVSGKTTNVSVMGADGSGEASLVYTWSATGPSAVSFSPNATNAAKNSLATFAKAGNYVLQAVIADPQGQTATSSVNVTVTQTLASITVNPGSATVATGATQQFTGSASDQFAGAMLPQPAFVWTVSGGGTISSTGLFTAASASGGPFMVTATSNSLLGTANVVITGNSPPTVQNYGTSFPLTEDPISESGNWINGGVVGLDWNNVLTTTGLAQGQSPSSAAYSDPTALLAGTWGPNQTVQATVYSINQNANYYQEVELRLRSRLSAHNCTGYEINFRCLQTSDAYMQIVRWNGALGSFTYVSSYNGAQYGVASGDVVKATIIGNVINVYKNGILIGTGTDSTYATGNPGIGFDFGCGSTYTDFGFTNLTASSP